jgi:beta-glucosidase
VYRASEKIGYPVKILERAPYLLYLTALGKAISGGVDLRGYFHWSLLDNLEWSAGFQQRFGLVYVDFTTQERTIKDSGRWYRQCIENNGIDDNETQ